MSETNVDEKDINTREKILKIATKIFAEKGFDGARVDEIAKQAGVNKALIYYYFESKKKLLEELFQKNIDDYINQKDVFGKQLSTIDHNQIVEYSDEILATLKTKDEVIKIALIEALKNNEPDFSLFKMMDMSHWSVLPKLKEMGLDIHDEANSLITGFFFGVAPVVFYVILGDKWAEFHNMDRNEFDLNFSSRLKEFYTKFATEFLNQVVE
ncbi:TetR/AcrR family transcriptional regulator [Paenibacillus sp. KQZ6P-2]|uniref:TetR/AcrR family transcriptional regulator n=1 Tax=Paenibacillus mangrovi TaxID=2931978 RepID=A0A9X2B2Q0_9BACL|nr:TetR/AcrR family transcriptional regulator [Paenibacillus mangrovi]